MSSHIINELDRTSSNKVLVVDDDACVVVRRHSIALNHEAIDVHDIDRAAAAELCICDNQTPRELPRSIRRWSVDRHFGIHELGFVAARRNNDQSNTYREP